MAYPRFGERFISQLVRSRVRSSLRSVINSVDKCIGLRDLMREDKPPADHPLAGDRAIEWSWVVSHLPQERSCILDVGCVASVLTGISARLGHIVTAVDLREIEYEMSGVTFHNGDFLELNLGEVCFDIIMNCSTIEHVGLPDRYGSSEFKNGDLAAMEKMGRLLRTHGRMLLTIPIGLDAVYSPFHRVYGAMRLPLLLKGYIVLEEEFWAKDETHRWRRCTKESALTTKGSESYYALGLFLLEKQDD